MLRPLMLDELELVSMPGVAIIAPIHLRQILDNAILASCPLFSHCSLSKLAISVMET
jgi:hypothetical protein